MAANGQLLQIAQNTALFSILGTTYGGDGVTTFALPDLRGRVSVGANANNPLGTTFGGQFTTLATAQMPAHDHTVLNSANTGSTGGGAAVNNDQPSLALNFLIAVNGIFPPRDSGGSFNETTPVLGQIVEFAGNFAPNGWLFANGQLLSGSIRTRPCSRFLEPNMAVTAELLSRCRICAVALCLCAGGNYFVGDVFGVDTITLTVANLAAHDHTLSDSRRPGARNLRHAARRSWPAGIRSPSQKTARRLINTGDTCINPAAAGFVFWRLDYHRS